MNTATRVAAYGAALVVVLGGGYLIGDLTDWGSSGARAQVHSERVGGMDMDMGPDMSMPASEVSPGGLRSSEAGYTLSLPGTAPRAGDQRLSFTIAGPDGKPVTRYETAHEKQLHLIAVRRDFSGFQHVHPVLDATTGTWQVRVGLTPGAWRVFTDFVPHGGKAITLGHDLLVPGDPGAVALPQPVRSAKVDGYTVLAAGDLSAGGHSMLDFTVTRHGEPVTDLQPYLGAYGHLVALREDDLAYLHVHPDGAPGDGKTDAGPSIDFGAEAPSTGRYHLYLNFKHDGKVHTAAFTLDAVEGGTGNGHDHEHG